MGNFFFVAFLTMASLAVVQMILIGLQTREHRRFARSRLELLRERLPLKGRVALFVPCKGMDFELEQNLHALLRQDYGNYQVTFVVESTDDPAYELVQRVAAAHPEVDCDVIVAGVTSTTGQKVHNLLAATDDLPSNIEYLAFADSDAKPKPYWLRALVSDLRRQEVGAVTGYRWFVPGQPSLANHLLYGINCNFASLIGKGSPHVIWGGSWAIRREVFDQTGLRQAWEGTLSDDLVATRVIRRARLSIEFEPACMVASPADNTLGDMLAFVRRQYVITKCYLPVAWLSTILVVSFANLALLATMAATVWALASRGLPVWIPAATLATLYLASVYRGKVRHDLAKIYFPDLDDQLRSARRFDVWTGPLVGLVSWLALLSSVVGRRITWRGNTYHIDRQGQIRLLRRDRQFRLVNGDDTPQNDQTHPEPEPTPPSSRTYRKAS